ncbi:MAG TPA: glycosyltransferase family 2 protein [Chlamydiales bacterium]|nr:glycosyltransferase family 2 protein [Chlamydiales bacterium]
MRKILFFLCFLLSLEAKATVCLNMIVKNESQVIEKCLNSLKERIDYWVIVDTGSTDGTQELIRKFMKGVPGELHERPWVNFAHNRNEALALAKKKGDYTLFIDADEVLVFDEGFKWPAPLDKDVYYMRVREIDAVEFIRGALIKNALDWKWVGALHEVIHCPDVKTYGHLEGVRNLCNTGKGARTQDPQKFAKDAKVLEDALKEEPDNERYVYYLAQCYFNAKEYLLAKKNYEKRLKMGQEDIHETFFSHYYLGRINEELNDLEAALECYYKAYEYRPNRIEPLFRISIAYRQQGKLLLGYLIAKYALTHPYPASEPAIEYKTYDQDLLIEFANCALLIGKFDEGLDACEKLLAKPNLPPDIKPLVEKNAALARTQLQKIKRQTDL